jgi:adenylosuccinate lyase
MKRYQIQPHRLSIDFELYTDGNSELKHELVTMIIQNLRELDQALESATQQPDVLKRTIHKIIPTISIIKDTAFSQVLHIPGKLEVNHDTLAEELNRFRMLCDEIIQSLEYELTLTEVFAIAV